MARLRPTWMTFAGVAILVTAGFAVMVVVSLVYPQVQAHRTKSALKAAAVAALPAGTDITATGVGGTGTWTGIASGHLAEGPAQLLSAPPTPRGSMGWKPIADCGKDLLCYVSAKGDHVLTLHVQPCIERGCPPGGSLVDAEVEKGGPNS